MRRLAVVALLAILAPAARAETLTLDQVVKLAVERNEQARIADASAVVADARLARARAFFYPTISVTGSYTRRAYEATRLTGTSTVTVLSHNALAASAQIAATLYDARSFPLYRQAQLDRESAHLSALDLHRQVAYQAADAFLQTFASQQVAEASARHLAFSHDQLLDAQRRFDAQLVGSNDVTRAQLAVANAERDFTRASGAVRAAKLQLGYLIDHPVGDLEVPGALLEVSTTPAAAAGTVADAQRRRLDIAAANLHVDALREAAKEPSRRFIPSLSLLGQYRITNEVGFSNHNTDWSIGLNLSWIIWDGGARAADEAAADAQVEIAGLQAKLTARSVTLQIDATTEALEDGQAAVKSAAAAVEFAKKNAAESEALYKQGLGTALAVDDAGAKLFDAEISLASERYRLATASLDRRSALGLTPTGQEGAR